MSYYSPSIEKLIQSFEKLPSIGNKTAARLAFYILHASEEETNEFVSSIINAKKNLKSNGSVQTRHLSISIATKMGDLEATIYTSNVKYAVIVENKITSPQILITVFAASLALWVKFSIKPSGFLLIKFVLYFLALSLKNSIISREATICEA